MLNWRGECCVCYSDIATKNNKQHRYVSESADASRNWCLGYMMMHDESFPETVKDQTDLEDTLELYFMICSTLSTNRAMVGDGLRSECSKLFFLNRIQSGVVRMYQVRKI
jgi:hypothetical protein